MRSIVSLCRHKWRSFSFVKRTDGLCAPSLELGEFAAGPAAFAVNPDRQRAKSRIAGPASLVLSSAISAHAGLAASGWPAELFRIAPKGISNSGSSMPSKRSSLAPASQAALRSDRLVPFDPPCATVAAG